MFLRLIVLKIANKITQQRWLKLKHTGGSLHLGTIHRPVITSIGWKVSCIEIQIILNWENSNRKIDIIRYSVANLKICCPVTGFASWDFILRYIVQTKWTNSLWDACMHILVICKYAGYPYLCTATSIVKEIIMYVASKSVISEKKH